MHTLLKPLHARKGKGKQAYSKKFRPSAEEDAAVKAFFADFPETDKQSPYKAADHDTPRAKMENPLPPGAKGLAASRWAKKEEEKPLLPPGEKALANSCFAKDAVEQVHISLLLTLDLVTFDTTAAQASTPVTSTATVTSTTPAADMIVECAPKAENPTAETTKPATSTTPVTSTTPAADVIVECAPKAENPTAEAIKPATKMGPVAQIQPAPQMAETDQSVKMKIAAIRAAEQSLTAAMASRQAAQMMLHASEEAIMIARAQLHQAQENFGQGLPKYEDYEQYEEEL
ncbi:hypothetical protein N0V85_002652 [Neurospora sp. IMI 360204]|nr:hypothetical protein N0V85_002652 [Neurospora sp. IMI 360204]